MTNELSPASPSIDPGLIDPGVVGPEVYSLTLKGVETADAIAQSEPFNYAAAELSLRNMAGLFNGPEAIDDATLADLDPVDVQRVHDLAAQSYDVLGDDAKEDAKANLEMYRPQSPQEAEVVMMRHGLNSFQQAVSKGPGYGYEASQEPAIRDLVKAYARTFASVYGGLNAIGHPLATDESRRAYFATNIRAATPINYESTPETADSHAPANNTRGENPTDVCDDTWI